MGNILAKLMELSREGFALTGAAKFADGAFMSVSVTVVHSTCTIWEEHLVVPSVTVETRGIMYAKLATRVKTEQLVSPMAMGQPANVLPTSKESIATKMWTNAPSTIHAKTELSAPTHTEDTHAPVVAALLERTAIKM